MKASGPQPKKHEWVGYWYCKPCNRIVTDAKHHAGTCQSLLASCERTGKDPFEILRQLSASECPDCYLGFRGKQYCPTCGNTKEPALDETGRRIQYGRPALPVRDFTAVLSDQADGIEVGEWYQWEATWTRGIKQGDGTTRLMRHTELIKAECVDINGPMLMWNDHGKRGLWKEHRQNCLRNFAKIAAPDDIAEDVAPLAVEECSGCGHPGHKGQCYYTEKRQTKPYVVRCQCGATPKTKHESMVSELAAIAMRLGG